MAEELRFEITVHDGTAVIKHLSKRNNLAEMATRVAIRALTYLAEKTTPGDVKKVGRVML